MTFDFEFSHVVQKSGERIEYLFDVECHAEVHGLDTYHDGASGCYADVDILSITQTNEDEVGPFAIFKGEAVWRRIERKAQDLACESV